MEYKKKKKKKKKKKIAVFTQTFRISIEKIQKMSTFLLMKTGEELTSISNVYRNISQIFSIFLSVK